MAAGKTTVVLIAGLSGSGKSALAKFLLRELPEAAAVSLDSYYKPLSHLNWEERARMNFDHPDALDWPLIRGQVEILASGGQVEAPVYDFTRHDREARTERIGPARFLIVEGLLALADESLRRLAALRIFVDTPPGKCLDRRTSRDVAERGRTPDSVHRQWRETVWPMAEAYILPSRVWADLIVSGEADLEQAARSVLLKLGV